MHIPVSTQQSVGVGVSIVRKDYKLTSRGNGAVQSMKDVELRNKGV